MEIKTDSSLTGDMGSGYYEITEDVKQFRHQYDTQTAK